MQRTALSIALLILLLSARAEQPAFSPTQVQRLTEDTSHPDDFDFWREVFSQSKTNLTEAEYADHLSLDGRQALTSHLTYDSHIPSRLLNALTALSISYAQHCDVAVADLPTTNKTAQITKFINALHYWQQGWLQRVASRPELDRALAEKLLPQVTPPNFWIGTTLARNPNTPPEMLETLSKPPYSLHFDLANNPNLPTNILWRILYDADRVLAEQFKAPETKREWSVINGVSGVARQARVALGSRNTTSAGVLSELATNAAREVRMAVGFNTNAPTQLLQVLTKDADAQVAVMAALGLAMSPKTPVSILQDLATNGGDIVRASVARNPATPRPLLEEMLRNDSYQVWTAAFKVLARQTNAPEQLLRERLRKAAPVERRSLSNQKDLPEWVYKAL